jgi:hypothetical protein
MVIMAISIKKRNGKMKISIMAKISSEKANGERKIMKYQRRNEIMAKNRNNNEMKWQLMKMKSKIKWRK